MVLISKLKIGNMASHVQIADVGTNVAQAFIISSLAGVSDTQRCQVNVKIKKFTQKTLGQTICWVRCLFCCAEP